MTSHVVAGVTRYTLATQELADLVADFHNIHFPDEHAVSEGAQTQVIRLEPHDRFSDLARVFEQRVFARDLGANHTPELMAQEYGPYESESTFYVAYNPGLRRILGVSRAIYGTGAELPKVFDLVCNNSECKELVWQKHAVELKPEFVALHHDIQTTDSVLDFATLAVSPEYRVLQAKGDLRPSTLLYAAMTRDSHFNRGDTFASGEATEQLLRFLSDLVGIPAEPIVGLPAFAAFEGDEVLSAPFVYRWDEWASAHEADEGKTSLGRKIYRLAEGSLLADAIRF